MAETHKYPTGEYFPLHGGRECPCEPRRVTVPQGVAQGRGRRQGYRYDVQYIHNPLRAAQ